MKYARAFALLALISLAGCGRTGLSLPAADAGAPRDGPPGLNACGGTGPLANEPGEPCGACGVFMCHRADSVRCEETATLNACGECGPTPEEECNGRDDDCDGTVDEGCAVRLTPLSTNESGVRLSADYAVLHTQTVGSNAMDVVLVDLRSFAWRYLSPHASAIGVPDDPTQDRDPSIDGTLVAWVQRRVDPLGAAGALMVHDLATGETRRASDLSSTAPAVNEGRVAFQVGGDGTSDVYLYTHGTSVVDPVAARADLAESSPDLSGEWLVYVRAPSEQWVAMRQVVARNLRTGEERALSEGLEGMHTTPAIDGTRVVWRREMGTSSPSQTGEVWLYDLSTGARRALSTGAHAEAPRVSGDVVCWSTTSSARDDAGLTVLDLRTGARRVLSREGDHCDVDARRVAWRASFGRGDTYLRALLPDEP